MKKIGILFHPKVEATQVMAKQALAFLSARGVAAWLCPAWETEQAITELNGTELLLSIGGDGTILHTAQVALHGGIPITGINLGTLGFMTELTKEEAEAKLVYILDGNGWIDERAMLEVSVSPSGKAQTYHALNDAVVARGAVTRLIVLEAHINGQHYTTYRADGVIVSTATGSTGYSLAAGGPILNPNSQEIILVPIVPHLSLGNALVLSPESQVQLKVRPFHQPVLTIDGHTSVPLSGDETISIKRSREIIRFLRVHPQNSFYSTLEQKLKGKK